MELIKQIDKEIEIENKRLDKLLEANFSIMKTLESSVF